MKKQATVRELAALVDGEVVGNGEVMISAFASLSAACAGEISFLVKPDASALEGCQASAMIAPKDLEGEYTFPLIKVADPYLAEAKIHSFLVAEAFVAKGIHSRAFVGEGSEIADEITIKALAYVGDNVKIGRGTTIEANAYIGDGVIIGENCTIKANVTVEHGTIIGNGVTIHPGSVIGADGYGYATDKLGNHYKRPQVGIVRIDDDVEIGANTCIDRATYGETHIKSGVKIDNLVQIGHNVVVGENSIIVSQVGIAGSTTLGRNVVMGARAAAVGHLHIGNRVMMAASASAIHDLEDGAVVGGTPAVPVRDWKRATVLVNKLPELHKDIKQLKKDVQTLSSK